METRQGHMLALREVCPMDVVAMLRRDVQAVRWASWTAKEP